MTNNVDSDQTAPIGVVCSGSTLFASKHNLSVMLGNYFQQTTSADNIFQMLFFLGALRVKCLLIPSLPAFSKCCLVILISKDANLIFYLSVYPFVLFSKWLYDVIIDFHVICEHKFQFAFIYFAFLPETN